MRQHKISRADVARVIAGVVASGEEEDEKRPEPGVWQTDENDLPKVPWAQAQAFRTIRGAHNKLMLEAREADVFKRVVPLEDRADFLRDLVMKSDSDVPLSRDSGYHILSQRCIGVSRRDWAAFLKKQAVLQRTQNIPVERRKGGVKIEARGHLEMDLIEGKKKDVVVTFLTDDWYWLSVCDVLTGLLIVKRLNNKEAGTTAQALADVLTEFRQALGAPLLSVSSDQGSEFKGAVARLLKRRNVTQKFVDRASRIEQQNAIFQRNFYRLYKLRRGTFHSLETQALRLVNNTRNKYIRMTPNEAVAAPGPALQHRARAVGGGLPRRDDQPGRPGAAPAQHPEADPRHRLQGLPGRPLVQGGAARRGEEADRRRLQVPRLRQVVRPRRPAARARRRRRLRCDCN